MCLGSGAGSHENTLGIIIKLIKNNVSMLMPATIPNSRSMMMSVDSNVKKPMATVRLVRKVAKPIFFTTYGMGGNNLPALRMVKPGKEVITLTGMGKNYGDGRKSRLANC